jgi:hypothetical protein
VDSNYRTKGNTIFDKYQITKNGDFSKADIELFEVAICVIFGALLLRDRDFNSFAHVGDYYFQNLHVRTFHSNQTSQNIYIKLQWLIDLRNSFINFKNGNNPVYVSPDHHSWKTNS